MSNPRHPLRLNVGFLLKSPIGTSRDFNFDFDTIRLGDDLTVHGLQGMARFDRTPQGLVLQGKYEASTELDCVRCLEPFSQTLGWSFTDLFAFDASNVTDSGLLIPENGYIDLEPLLREYALLEFPISPVCKPECRGLCPVCGENLNKTDCGHQRLPDAPFAAPEEVGD